MIQTLAFSQDDFIPADRLAIAVNDAGFVWGASVTDLCRTFQQRLYRWPDHLARFRRSCRSVHIDVPLSDERITQAANMLVDHNAGAGELILVLLATPGRLGYMTGDEHNSGPTFLMHTFPIPYARYRRLFEQGARLVVPRTTAPPASCIDPHIKQRSRMHWWLAEHEARHLDPAASALLVNDAGLITETALANFLLVCGNVVIAPLAELVLEGISLRVVRELCAEMGLAYREEPLRLDDCLACDEALLTSTAFCVAGVRSINGRELRWPGPVCERLLERWSVAVGVDIRRQILGG